MGTGVRKHNFLNRIVGEKNNDVPRSICEPNEMRCSIMSPKLFIVLMVILGGSLTACAEKEKSMFSIQDEHYQQILERQKAGIQPEPKAPVDLSKEMDQEDFERLGDVHLGQGDFQSAKVQYEKALDMEPERVNARYKLGVIYLEAGAAQNAYDEFHRILDYNLDFAPAYEGMGRALLKMEREQEAEQEFHAALLYDENLWTSQNYLGILFDRRHEHQQAIQMYEVALEQNAQNPAVLNNLGMAYYLDKQYENAVRTFQEAMKVGGPSQKKIANNLGLALTKLGHYDLAFDAYIRGMDQAKAYNNLGVAFLEEGQFARASRCFESAIDAQPTFYEKAKENLTVSNRMLARLPMVQQQTLLRRQPKCL